MLRKLKYHLINGLVVSIGYNDNFNTEATGEEPFFKDWDQAHKWRFENGEWQLIIPEDFRYVDLELTMPDRLGFQRRVFVNALPSIDLKNGVVVVEIQVKHYLNDVWQYNNNIQDKFLTMIADDSTRIPIDNEGNTWGEFQYLLYLFENVQVYFLQEVASIVQDRINTGLIDTRLEY